MTDTQARVQRFRAAVAAAEARDQGHRLWLVAERHARKTSAGSCERCNRVWPCPDYQDASGMTPLF